MQPIGTNFQNPNRANVAQAMGAKGIRLEDPAKVEDAFREALAHRGGPVVVDAVLDRFALSIPSHVPLHVARRFTLSASKQIAAGNSHFVLEEIEHNRNRLTSPGLRPQFGRSWGARVS